ncbi:MAG: HAMP domain-containing histidine kinase [Rubrivivax sp.]|nr:HAMP domain-containing histidine kinase [Rubrivivax sp.]
MRSWLVIVAGLLLMQTLGFGVISHLKEQQIRASMLSFMSKDAALAHKLLQGATPAGRETWLKALDRGFYRMDIGPVAHPNETVRPGVLPALEPVRTQVAGLVQRDDVRWVWLDDVPTLELPLGGGQALHMVAADPLPSTTMAWQAAYAGVLLLTAGLVAWAVVRMLMHPLNGFFTAARAFGQDIQNPLLQVTGPTEVREVARVFNQMQVRIRRQIDERTQIVSSISHDLQTPITRLRLRADLIDDENLRRRFASDLDAMSSMVREGLEYARSSQLREARVPIDLTALAESLADQVADLGQDVRVEGRIERPYVGALRAMERALLNLINNAVKFGGRARVLLSEDAAGACIKVVDPGPGVPPELLDQLFDPFFRVEASRSRDHGGTGLGLTIARNLIRAHGGDITVANGEGSGFVATLTLPRSLRG